VIETRGDLNFDHEPERSFRVRSRLEGEDSKDIERQVGGELENESNSVDLENPEDELAVYRKGDEYILGEIVEDIDRGLFEKRSNEKRPFSSPVSLDPVTARLLVNLSGIEPCGKLLDPFCGTGGILIEAGLCGVAVHGRDASQEMVSGSRKNLEEYGIINHDIRHAEVSKSGEDVEEFDAVVTDLPYGKASKETGEPVEEFLKLLDSGVPSVFMYNKESFDGLEPEFEIYVHKNLTRYIYLENINY
jgi:tRNA (guanine10-N2)-dimethyltransferase